MWLEVIYYEIQNIEIIEIAMNDAYSFVVLHSKQLLDKALENHVHSVRMVLSQDCPEPL